MNKLEEALDIKFISYCLKSKSLAISVFKKVQEDFLRKDYFKIISLIKECIIKYNEIPTLNMLKRCNDWNDLYEDIVINAKNLEIDKDDFVLDLEDLQNRYKKNEIIKAGVQIFQKNLQKNQEFLCLDDATKYVKKLSNKLNKLERNEVYEEGSVSETADEAFKEYIKKKENPELAKGIHLGITYFDDNTNGLHESELMLIGGESGAGKSLLAMNMAINAWKGSNTTNSSEFIADGANVVYFTIEMPFSPFRQRLDACLAGISLNNLKNGKMTQEEEDAFQKSINFQKRYPKKFYIVDIPRGCSVKNIEAKYLELIDDFIPQLIVVDYVGIMKSDSDNESDWVNLGKIAEDLHEFCRTYKIPCISPVQLNRPSRNGPQKADQNRVGRSLMLVQNTNIMLNINTREDEDLKSDLEIIVAKMRDGGKGSFHLYKQFDKMRVLNVLPEGSFDDC
jgi:replicative DNA helicase